MPSASPESCPGPAQLAWLGDAVWELHQRQALVMQPASPRSLHAAGVSRVRAEAQSQALERLEPLLREEEREWVRRGRNAAGRRPRHLDPAVYGRASGFETMVGWLHLHDPDRLNELLRCLDLANSADRPDSPP